MIEQIKDLLVYWELVALALVVWYAVRAWFQGQNKLLRHLVRAAVGEAEEMFGGGTGPLKWEYVVSTVYEGMPAILRPFVSEEKIDDWINTALKWMEASLTSDEQDTAGN